MFRRVSFADTRAMRRELSALIASHGVLGADVHSRDLSPAEADAFARDLESIRGLPTANHQE